MLGRLKLGTQFTVVLTIVFVCGILLSNFALWQTAQREAEEDVATKAQILMETMNSVRSYTSSNIDPLLERSSQPGFIRELVPAFSAREIFDRFRDRPEYHSFFYKEATLNPTNVRDQADTFETKLVEQFRTQPTLSKSGYRTTEEGNLFYIARPLSVEQSSCLQCHSHPSVAPQSLITTYGDKNGFGWKLHDVVAAQTVYVPADEVFSHTRRTTLVTMSVFSSIFATAILVLNGLLKRRVIHPIKQLTAIAHQVSAGNITKEELAAFEPRINQTTQRADETGQLARAFQYMAHEVADREQNLNQAVEQRTAELAESTQEAEQAKAKAEAANSAKSQFLSNMSHELRTPLNVILGFTQLMTGNNSLPLKQQEYLNTISRSGEHLLTLINDVLEMSKIEAGRITLNPTTFELHSLLDSLQQMLTFTADAKGLKLIFERSLVQPLFIHTDESKLRQVLINLLGNAVKFTQTGTVTLRVRAVTRADSLNLLFEIEDTGPGIALAEQEHLFKPFVQTEVGRSTPGGTGLGLSISRRFVQLMGGEITVSSVVRVGTIFKFNIQTQMMEPQVHHSQAKRRQVIGLEGQRTYRILIVEDKPENRQLLLELLTPIGFEVQEATNGQEAIALTNSWFPDLIWMDIRMPVMDGYEAVKQIKSSGNSAPVVVALTGSVFEEERLTALAMGFDDFVRKPFQTDLILTKMAEHLNLHYCYASVNGKPEQTNVEPAGNGQIGVITSDLTAMPVEWIEQLHQAATRVNAKLILDLVAQIPPSNVALIRELKELVHHFDFEKIIALTRHRLTSDSRIAQLN